MKETGTITKINQTGQYPTKDRDTKQPITMKIYSIDFKHLQNTTYYNPHDLKVQVGDFVEFEYNQADKKVSGIKKIVQPMHGNYKPNNFEKESEHYISPTEFRDNNIFFQSARRDFVLINQGRNLSLQEIHDGALELYKKHKQIKNQL